MAHQKSDKGHAGELADLTRKIAGTDKIEIEKRVELIEKYLDIKLPLNIRRFLSAVVKSGTGVDYREWRFTAEDVFDYSKLEGKNSFEEMVLLDQANYLGTFMQEMFSNSIFFGFLGNGDAYMWDYTYMYQKPLAKTGEIIFFDHETYNVSAFANSADTLAKVSRLLEEYSSDEKTNSAKLKKEMEGLRRSVNLSFHYNDLTTATDISPSYTLATGGATNVWRFFRSLWVTYLLRDDGVHTIPNILDLYFNQRTSQERNLNGKKYRLKDQLVLMKSFPTFSLSTIYLIWEAYFTEPDTLDAICKEVQSKNKSPLVADAVKLVMSLHKGERKSLGKIEDVPSLQKRMLEAIAEREKGGGKKKKVSVDVDAVAAGKTVAQIKEEVWKHIDDPKTLQKIYAKAAENEVSIAADMARIEYISKEKWNRKGSSFDFEQNELNQEFVERDTDLAPLLFSLGMPVKDESAKPAIIASVNSIAKSLDPNKEIPHNLGLRSLAYVSVPELEDTLMSYLPKNTTGDIVKDINIVWKIEALAPCLAKMKSKKAVPVLTGFMESLLEKAKGTGDNALRAKNSVIEHGLLITKTLAQIGDISAKPTLDKLAALNTVITPHCLYALLECGDTEAKSKIKALAEKTIGNPATTVLPKMLYAYAQDKLGEQPDLEIVRTALKTALATDVGWIHSMALTVAAHRFEKGEAKEVLMEFLSHENSDVRTTAKKLLEEMGEKVELVYADYAYCEYVHENDGKAKLLELLKSPFTVYKHEIIRFLTEKKDTEGLFEAARNYIDWLVSFDSSWAAYWSSHEWYALDYCLYALASMKNKEVDDYLIDLGKRGGAMIKNNDLFKYQNYPMSAYLKKQVTMGAANGSDTEADESKEKEEKSVASKKSSLSKTLLAEEFGPAQADKKWILGSPINGFAFSPDGKYAIAAGSEKTAIFDGEGKELFNLSSGWAFDAVFNPDGSRVAVGYHAGHVHIHDPATGKIKEKFQFGSVPHGARKVKFSPDGKQIAVASDSGSVGVFKLGGSAKGKTIEIGIDVNSVDWFPEGDKLAICTDKTAEIIDLKKGKSIKKIDIHAAAEIQIFVDEKGKTKIIVGGQKEIVIYDDKLKAVKKLKQTAVSRVRLTKDQKYLYAASYEGNDLGVWRWDMTQKVPKRKRVGHDHAQVLGMDLHPVTQEIYAGGDDRMIYHWSTELEPAPMSEYVGHKSEVESMIYDSAGKKLYTGDDDGGVIEWSDTEKPKLVWKKDGVKFIESLALEADGETLFIGASDNRIELNLKTKAEKIKKVKGRCRAATLFNGKVVAGEYTLGFHGEPPASKFNDAVSRLVVKESTKELIAAPFLDAWICILDEKIKVKKNIEIQVESHGVYDMDISKDGKLLYVSCSDKVVRIYDTETWEIKTEFKHKYSLDLIAISPNGEFLAAAYGGTIELYKTSDLILIGKEDFGGEIEKLVFVSDDALAYGDKLGLVKKVKIS